VVRGDVIVCLLWWVLWVIVVRLGGSVALRMCDF